VLADGAGLHPAAHAAQSTLDPSAESGWIRQARRIFAVWRCLLNRITCSQMLTSLLPATHAERRQRHQPIWQDRKRLSAWMTDPSPHRHAFMLVVVGLTESPSMADDCAIPADRALPGQQAQWDHPGSTLFFASGSAIKRITAGVKARRGRSPPSFRSTGRAFTLRLNQFERKKNTALPCSPPASHSNIGRLSPTTREQSGIAQKTSERRIPGCLG
jgi:hypothetical protein